MTRRFLLPAFLLLLFNAARAETIHVGVNDNFFSPVSFPVKVGDTITWTLLSGFHTTTSSSVPDGAATWDYAFSAPGDSFSYVVTVAGVYTYVCTYHPGMEGSFTTQATSSLREQPEPHAARRH